MVSFVDLSATLLFHTPTPAYHKVKYQDMERTYLIETDQ